MGKLVCFYCCNRLCNNWLFGIHMIWNALSFFIYARFKGLFLIKARYYIAKLYSSSHLYWLYFGIVYLYQELSHYHSDYVWIRIKFIEVYIRLYLLTYACIVEFWQWFFNNCLIFMLYGYSKMSQLDGWTSRLQIVHNEMIEKYIWTEWNHSIN